MQPCDPATAIAEARRPVRWDDWTQVPGPAAAFIRDELGVRSTVGAPIVVEGRLWGVLAVHSKQDVPLPPDTEWRLQQFTELVATAIGNAEARAEAARLANEQAALRRVATLVAREVSPAEVFAKVAEEAAEALGDVECCLLRDQRDGTATVVAARGPAISAAFPVGRRLPVDGIGSAVGYPIVVRGEIWGALVVTTSGEPPHAPETERRIAQFADLVATAVGNAQARAELGRLADEQAALRRVATLVAHGERPGEIFSAVSDEVARLFETDLAAVVRFEHDREATVVGTSKMPADLIPIGTRWPLDDALASAEVQRTGCSARMSGTYWKSLDTPVAKRLADLDIVSSVASPVVVDGAIWGAVIVASGDELPTDSEERLQRFGDLVATAIANAESKSELAASRRRIVAASDEARRRIERDLHDGTQQRLVSLGLAVRAAEANVPPDRDDLRSELHGIATGLGAAVEELQELSRGIHPAILSQGGLGPALRTLARRSAVPVELDLATDTRVSPAIEVAAYYVVSEGLANAAKHAQASRIEVSLARRDNVLLLSIRDDGVGGADPLGGSGLVGMTDRLEALGGSIRVKSPPGEGTSISAELPL
jgi:signal transduction histidine kinase